MQQPCSYTPSPSLPPNALIPQIPFFASLSHLLDIFTQHRDLLIPLYRTYGTTPDPSAAQSAAITILGLIEDITVGVANFMAQYAWMFDRDDDAVMVFLERFPVSGGRREWLGKIGGIIEKVGNAYWREGEKMRERMREEVAETARGGEGMIGRMV